MKKLVTEGPIALWEMIKEKAAEIKQQVMEGIRNWVITQVVKQAVIKLVSFLNPAGAIVQAVLAIYNVIMFFVENIQRIIDFVKSVFDSIGDIVLTGSPLPSDAFRVAKFSGDGTPRWVRTYASTDFAFGASVAVDGTDHILVSGPFRGTLTVGDKTLAASGDEEEPDLFVIKLAP